MINSWSTRIFSWQILSVNGKKQGYNFWQFCTPRICLRNNIDFWKFDMKQSRTAWGRRSKADEISDGLCWSPSIFQLLIICGLEGHCHHPSLFQACSKLGHLWGFMTVLIASHCSKTMQNPNAYFIQRIISILNLSVNHNFRTPKLNSCIFSLHRPCIWQVPRGKFSGHAAAPPSRSMRISNFSMRRERLDPSSA